MNKKEELFESFRKGYVTVEDLVDRIIQLEEKVSIHGTTEEYVDAVQFFVGLSLSSYCNGFFSKGYDLHNYTIKSISFIGNDLERNTHVLIANKETDEMLEETIHYSFFDTLEMLGEWTQCRHPKLYDFKH